MRHFTLSSVMLLLRSSSLTFVSLARQTGNPQNSSIPSAQPGSYSNKPKQNFLQFCPHFQGMGIRWLHQWRKRLQNWKWAFSTCNRTLKFQRSACSSIPSSQILPSSAMNVQRSPRSLTLVTKWRTRPSSTTCSLESTAGSGRFKRSQTQTKLRSSQNANSYNS